MEQWIGHYEEWLPYKKQLPKFQLWLREKTLRSYGSCKIIDRAVQLCLLFRRSKLSDLPNFSCATAFDDLSDQQAVSLWEMINQSGIDCSKITTPKIRQIRESFQVVILLFFAFINNEAGLFSNRPNPTEVSCEYSDQQTHFSVVNDYNLDEINQDENSANFYLTLEEVLDYNYVYQEKEVEYKDIFSQEVQLDCRHQIENLGHYYQDVNPLTQKLDMEPSQLNTTSIPEIVTLQPPHDALPYLQYLSNYSTDIHFNYSQLHTNHTSVLQKKALLLWDIQKEHTYNTYLNKIPNLLANHSYSTSSYITSQSWPIWDDYYLETLQASEPLFIHYMTDRPSGVFYIFMC